MLWNTHLESPSSRVRTCCVTMETCESKHTQASQCVGMTKHVGDMKSSDTKISTDTDTHVVITPPTCFFVQVFYNRQ